MWARVDHTQRLNGYIDERTALDNSTTQVRVTFYQMPDHFDCFGAEVRTLEAIS
jgi:hypothetical protein